MKTMTSQKLPPDKKVTYSPEVLAAHKRLMELEMELAEASIEIYKFAQRFGLDQMKLLTEITGVENPADNRKAVLEYLLTIVST